MKNDQHQFIEDMGQLMAGWGLPRPTGRIFGYLLLQPQPACLDQIAVDLELAKSGISVATRQLLAMGVIRSIGERGTRRLSFEAVSDLEAIFAARNAQMLNLVDRLRQGAQAATVGPVRERLAGMAAAVQNLMDEMRELMRSARIKQHA